MGSHVSRRPSKQAQRAPPRRCRPAGSLRRGRDGPTHRGCGQAHRGAACASLADGGGARRSGSGACSVSGPSHPAWRRTVGWACRLVVSSSTFSTELKADLAAHRAALGGHVSGPAGEARAGDARTRPRRLGLPACWACRPARAGARRWRLSAAAPRPAGAARLSRLAGHVGLDLPRDSLSPCRGVVVRRSAARHSALQGRPSPRTPERPYKGHPHIAHRPVPASLTGGAAQPRPRRVRRD